jgi:hypothetical protein
LRLQHQLNFRDLYLAKSIYPILVHFYKVREYLLGKYLRKLHVGIPKLVSLLKNILIVLDAGAFDVVDEVDR